MGVAFHLFRPAADRQSLKKQSQHLPIKKQRVDGNNPLFFFVFFVT